ncbi:MAG TPA: HAMP domain-containing sensor histidine kinase [Lachnospiraceae bacterium]|nr:HAMP domain-containing sensor histidine kinase [Lachnospiraceae bacterium]
MFKKLKRRLVLLYSITTSIILTCVVIIVFYINARDSRQHSLEMFQKSVNQITDNIQYTSSIDSSWLARIQEESNLYIYIEENNIPIDSISSLPTQLDKNHLVRQLKEKVTEEGFLLNSTFLYTEKKSSGIFTIKTSSKESYRGCVSIIPTSGSTCTVYVIEIIRTPMQSFLQQFFLFAGIDILGILLLFLFSYAYIGKILLPLEEGHRKQVEFIAAASHELRSPLTVINTGITSIKGDLSQAENFIPHIEKECSRMIRLVNDLLLLANSDARNWTLHRDHVDMDTLLIEVYDMFCTLINREQIDIRMKLPDGSLPSVTGDYERIKQVLTILLDNALRYTDPQKGVTINASMNRNSILIEIEDYGVGIPDDQKKLVFDRFYQADRSRNDKNHYGLGLSIAKELIGQHHGTITVKDTRGGGATFCVELPTV